MQKKSSQTLKVERDPRLFMVFLTLVVSAMYLVTLWEVPGVRAWAMLLPFTILVVIHILLHWFLEKLSRSPTRLIWYFLVQGMLATLIAWLGQSLGIIFAVFMGLIGEAVGLYGLNRRSLLAGGYYLLLLVISIVQTSDLGVSGWILTGIIPITIFVVIYVTLYMRQMEAREKAQALAAELESANRQLTEFAARVEDLTIANERQRMARELHDTLSQGLAGLILQLEAVQAHLALDNTARARTILADVMDQARRTLTTARQVIDNLRQPSTDDLESVLQDEVDRFSGTTGIPCELHVDPLPPLAEPVKDAVTRTVSEALSNIAKHARAQNASVTLRMLEGHLTVRIQDDGQGFNPASIPPGHYGLLGMQERARMLNGTLEMLSQPASGTTILLVVPS